MINNLENVATKVIRLLRESGHDDAAQDIERLLERLLSSTSEQRPDIVKAINDRCHPKWLGDLNVRTASWEEWMQLLSDLRNKAR